MNRKLSRFFTVSMVLLSFGVAVGSADSAADKTLKEIAGYRKWTRLNEKPMPVTFGGDLGG
jgi:hypothetical protein